MNVNAYLRHCAARSLVQDALSAYRAHSFISVCYNSSCYGRKGQHSASRWALLRQTRASFHSPKMSLCFFLPSLIKWWRGCYWTSPLDSTMQNNDCFLKLYVSCVYISFFMFSIHVFGCLPWLVRPILEQSITFTGSRSLPVLETCPNHVNLPCAILSTNVLSWCVECCAQSRHLVRDLASTKGTNTNTRYLLLSATQVA